MIRVIEKLGTVPNYSDGDFFITMFSNGRSAGLRRLCRLLLLRQALPDDFAENGDAGCSGAVWGRAALKNEAAGIGAGVGHRQDAGTIMFQVRVEFIGNLVAGAATTGASGSPPWIMNPSMTR